jgi:gamma-glutamylcysteine synthetase
MQGFRPSGRPLEELKTEWQAAMRNTVRKKAITVRIQERDIARLEARVLQKRFPIRR